MQTKTNIINHLGGRMYGDGEYVVEFRNAGSCVAPLRAAVLTPSGTIYDIERISFEQPSVEVAALIIAEVKRAEARA